jgi:hypothetical protein
MSEQKPEKKVVGRTVVITLGIIAVILAVGLVGAVADYTSIIGGKDNTIANDNNTITQTETWLNANITSLTTEITSLQSSGQAMSALAALKVNGTWVNDQIVSQSASSYTNFTRYDGAGYYTDYSGYISVNVWTSTTNNTYVEVIWSAYGVNYDNRITVGTGGTAVFPVLPAKTIEIRVGNTNLINGATETVTITYVC